MNKPDSYYEGYQAYQEKIDRARNPYTWLGKMNRGRETWWFTGFDDAKRDR